MGRFLFRVVVGSGCVSFMSDVRIRQESFVFSVGIHCAADCCAALPYAFRPVPAAVDGKEPPGVSYARFVFAHGGGRLPCAAGEKQSLKERI